MVKRHKSKKIEDSSVRIRNVFIGGDAAIGKKAAMEKKELRSKSWQDNKFTYMVVGVVIILIASFIWTFFNTPKDSTTEVRNETGESGSIIIIESRWINEDESFLILDNQVKVEVDNVWSGLESVNVVIRISDANPVFLTAYKEAKRQTFVYKNQEYFFDVLNVRDNSAEISISKKV